MQYEAHKAQLESELDQVVSELETIATRNIDTDDWVAIPITEELGNTDENVEADAVEEWGTRRAILEQLETRYQNIKRALEKMETGTYGICEISGGPIEAERLAANPSARTSIANRDREQELSL